jgi:hypothetical protein
MTVPLKIVIQDCHAEERIKSFFFCMRRGGQNVSSVLFVRARIFKDFSPLLVWCPGQNKRIAPLPIMNVVKSD